MKSKWTQWLPAALVAVFALSRWPGVMPLNFSAAYALAFCAAVYFRGRGGWALPFGALLLSDLGLNLYYYFKLGINGFSAMLLANYAAYGLIIWLGRRFSPRSSLAGLISGGLLGAVWFYLITNSAAWLFNPFQNPEYTRSLSGWIVALTKGTSGYPETWQFFRNTLLSGGLFTGLFAGAMKLSASMGESREEAEEPEAEEGAAPEESKA